MTEFELKITRCFASLLTTSELLNSVDPPFRLTIAATKSGYQLHEDVSNCESGAWVSRGARNCTEVSVAVRTLTTRIDSLLALS